MADVRAKFRVSSITPITKEPPLSTVELHPVYSEDPTSENKAYWDATPAGSIQLSVLNAAAVAKFEVGAEYYVDFTKA